MRIAMVTETYPPEVNGVARTIGLMAEGLQERGHAIQLVRPRQNGHDHAMDSRALREVLRPGIPIPRYTQLKMGMPSGRVLAHAWREQRPDIVHIATEGPLGWSALAAARRLGIPVATDFHTNFHTYMRDYGMAWLARPVAAFLRSFHNRAACTMVPTREMADDLAAIRFERLRVVGRGVNPAVFSPERRSRELRATWGAGDDTPVALCVSRFAHEKNFALVIEAYEAMRRVRADTRLVLVGDGPLAETLKQRNVGYVIAGRKVNGELSRALRIGRHLPVPQHERDLGQRDDRGDGERPGRRGLRLRGGARGDPPRRERPARAVRRRRRLHRARRALGARPAARPHARARRAQDRAST